MKNCKRKTRLRSPKPRDIGAFLESRTLAEYPTATHLVFKHQERRISSGRLTGSDVYSSIKEIVPAFWVIGFNDNRPSAMVGHTSVLFINCKILSLNRSVRFLDVVRAEVHFYSPTSDRLH
ncbi:hypothetical protein J6590_042005 [Homalodisca vitripennis]|nr:hypothetical protein J6590_042005 [Homalodisca vitripennis]